DREPQGFGRREPDVHRHRHASGSVSTPRAGAADTVSQRRSRDRRSPSAAGRERAPKASDTAASSRVRLLALLLVISGVVAYANSLTNPFVFDDQTTILDNRAIQQLWPLSTALLGQMQSAIAGRPVVGLTFAINFALSG